MRARETGRTALTPLCVALALAPACQPDIGADLPPSAAPSGTLESRIVMTSRDGDRTLAAQVEAARAEAAAAGMQPFVQLTAEWCHICQRIEASLEGAALQEALRGVYLVRIDTEAWDIHELKAAGFGKPIGLPVFYQLDGQGRSAYKCDRFGSGETGIARSLAACMRNAPPLPG